MTLDRILGAAGPLLRRVDTILSTSGAPADHAVWDQLRRVRLLPGDAVNAVAALRPADLVDAPLRAAAASCAVVAEELPAPGDWEGEAAEAYDRARLTLADQMSGAPDSLDVRLKDTAELADSLIDWMQAAQDALAGVLAEMLGSREALALSSSASNRENEAAADLAVPILRVVGDAYDRANDLVRELRRLRSLA